MGPDPKYANKQKKNNNPTLPLDGQTDTYQISHKQKASKKMNKERQKFTQTQ